MTFTLHVDGARWRAAMDAVVAARPGIVPVVKGNGYGFGRDLLCAEASRLDVPMIAVGTYVEVPSALAAFGRDILVMEPYRAAIHADLPDLGNRRLVHTITTRPDLDHLRVLQPTARVVVEGLTSMKRFGAPAAALGDLVAASDALGVTLHLPLGTGHVAEITSFIEAAPGMRRWYLSHVSPSELASLRSRYPEHRFLARVGTDLWLADRSAYEVRAHVLDVRPVAKGETAGYRQRPLPAGHLVVVSGGTSHGVAMESPASAATARSRAIAVAEGVLEAAHRVRSPFTVAGVSPRFAEPPHMQCSLLALPEGVAPPRVGDTVTVRMRLTTAYPDAVVVS
ncbi:alanine racemase [Intrasporangium oryzae NRRL B-24470]|uniref:Alanine racemase n=1 Tax=Intrasporangium oryzae NRRL B-24470 TaxID=1386089 RepID=W9G700_9MICO|nr:alanine racemase [Intrasporangium oryzae]EWT01810.1 alanine racemase [Intrasporangium oryzae NRRL B-24470]